MVFLASQASTSGPLAERVRPQTLDEYIGQSHLCGEQGVLSNLLAQDTLPSIILWGPPGTGKTTLAFIISKALKRPFAQLSAISSGVKDIREVIEEAKHTPGTILFIDEIHRFNKSQQDALLGAVEKGVITLIGATTENPSFEVNSALLSRCQVYTLKSLSSDELKQLVHQAIEKDNALSQLKIEIAEWESLLVLSGGDGRKLLNLFELAVDAVAGDIKVITNALVQKVAQQKTAVYDKNGEQHYDIISAFIKSMRGSDPNAAVYWLARMIEGGEDVQFIARRMVIFASEDIGISNVNALVLANSCFDAVKKIGYPEARIILSQCAVYLACSSKSNSTYMAINDALALVQKTGDLPVPLHLRNAPTKLMKEMGYGDGYQYSHNYDGNFSKQHFLPDDITGQQLYKPGNNPKEAEILKQQKHLWGQQYYR